MITNQHSIPSIAVLSSRGSEKMSNSSNCRGVVVGNKYCFEEETSLTVHKTCVFLPGDAFIVYGPHGQVIFRFDSYGEPRDELALMDASGKTLLTLVRKKPSLHQRWDGYLGERNQDHVEPIFSVFKSGITRRSRLIVEVHRNPREEYNIKGSYSQRSCKIYYNANSLEESLKELVAEIKRKVEPTSHVMLGKDVFWLCVKPGFDAAFAMGIVLVLDQIFDDEDDEDEDGDCGDDANASA